MSIATATPDDRASSDQPRHRVPPAIPGRFRSASCDHRPNRGPAATGSSGCARRCSRSRIPAVIVFLARPVAMATVETPPQPNAMASVAAHCLRIRSSIIGASARNFSRTRSVVVASCMRPECKTDTRLATGICSSYFFAVPNLNLCAGNMQRRGKSNLTDFFMPPATTRLQEGRARVALTSWSPSPMESSVISSSRTVRPRKRRGSLDGHYRITRCATSFDRPVSFSPRLFEGLTSAIRM